MTLQPLFAPRSIAVVGASERPSPGRAILASLRRFGFDGGVYPVNPRYQSGDIAAGAMGHRLLFGALEQVADGLEAWFTAGVADGCNIMPPWFPGAFEDFVGEVVPILQKRGLFRTEYQGTTLREHLGLARPASRWADPAG